MSAGTSNADTCRRNDSGKSTSYRRHPSRHSRCPESETPVNPISTNLPYHANTKQRANAQRHDVIKARRPSDCKSEGPNSHGTKHETLIDGSTVNRYLSESHFGAVPTSKRTYRVHSVLDRGLVSLNSLPLQNGARGFVGLQNGAKGTICRGYSLKSPCPLTLALGQGKPLFFARFRYLLSSFAAEHRP
jgi:hypothetical protein